MDESGEAADGEEITNKIPRIEGGLKEHCSGLDANHRTPQMCPIHADFKHFRGLKAKDFCCWRKVSSIMWAKVLSIMRAEARQVTMG